MATDETVTVEVVTGWAGGHYGSREPGDTFDYDWDGDPADLVKLGLVKQAGAKAAAKPASEGAG